MNAKNPSWSNGPNLPYSARHGVMYTIGDHLYMLGGYQYDSSCYGCCRPYHYRISETDSSWSSRSIHYSHAVHYFFRYGEVPGWFYALAD